MKIRSYLNLLTLIIFLFMFVSCQLLSNRPICITSYNNNKTCYLKEGDVFLIKLESSPSTGKIWDIFPYDDNVIGFVSSKFIYDDSVVNKKLTGQRLIEFKALSKGRTDLNLAYYKIWDKNKTPIEILKFIIVVE